MTDETDTEPLPEVVTEFKLGALVLTKEVNMTLKWHGLLKVYEVETISDTTFYKPGTRLSEGVVTKIQNMKGWHFIAHKAELPQLPLNVVASLVPGVGPLMPFLQSLSPEQKKMLGMKE